MVDTLIEKPRLLTYSRTKEFRACQRRHYYSYELGYRPCRAADALVMGTAFHVGTAEVYWNARKDGRSLEEATALAMAATRAHCDAKNMDIFLAIKNMVMAAVYTAAWNSRPDVKCLAVEVQFELPLTHGKRESTFWRRAGKIDAILRLEDGRIAVCEHKTSTQDASPGSDYRRRLTQDEQISMYFEAAHALGFPADLILYDVIKKPMQRPKMATSIDSRYKKDGGLKKGARETDETPDEFFARLLEEQMEKGLTSCIDWIEVYRLDNQRKRFGDDLIEQAKMMRWAIENNIHPKNSDACFAYHGSSCAFLEVCEGTARLEDAGRFYIPKTKNPELEEPKSLE